MKVANTKYGQMMFPDNDNFTGRSLEKCGEAQSAEIDFLLDFVDPEGEDVFVDIGCGIGNVVVPMAKKIGSNGYVLAIEASSFLYNTLCGNIALNHLGNVQAFNRAATDNSNSHCYYPDLNPIAIMDYRDVSLSTLLNSEDHLGRKRDQHVATICLDDLRLANPKMVKIDISGMEMQALTGLKRTIQRANPYLFIRCKEPNQNIVNYVQSLGYDWEVHATPAWREDNFLRSPNIFEDEQDRAYLFCYPKDKKFESEFACPMSESDERWEAFQNLRD